MRTIPLQRPVSVLSYAAVGGKQEGEGPLGPRFDEIDPDSFCGRQTWEQAESELQSRALRHALRKCDLHSGELDLAFGGDLMNQCIATTFALRDEGIPFYGIYGACSTMGEGLSLAAMLLSGGQFRRAAVTTSSHFCTAERQYRNPLPYGSQRTPTAQWTATAAGCCILGTAGGICRITHVCPGKIKDLGITDVNNMGAAMAPAAIDTLRTVFIDTHTTPQDYDMIFTGDLGELGHDIVADLMGRQGYDLHRNYHDCGLLLYDRKGQDMHAGGSGAGCSASVLCSWILPQMRCRAWKRVLFAPTGALLSPTSSFQGESIPGICHAVILEGVET